MWCTRTCPRNAVRGQTRHHRPAMARSRTTAPAAAKAVLRSLPAVAAELQGTMAAVPPWASGLAGLGIRESDVQRAVCRAIQSQLGAVAAIEGPLPEDIKQYWGGWLGRPDVLARPEGSGELYFETKLCVTDNLYEAVWDTLKLALLTALSEGSAGYLVYVAQAAAWEPGDGRPTDLFEGTSCGVAELVGDRHPDLWQWCLDGTRSTRPICLPARLRTEAAGSAAIGAGENELELRCALVRGEAGEGWVGFDGDGWPAAVE